MLRVAAVQIGPAELELDAEATRPRRMRSAPAG